MSGKKICSGFPDIFLEINLFYIAGTYEEISDALCRHEAHVKTKEEKKAFSYLFYLRTLDMLN